MPGRRRIIVVDDEKAILEAFASLSKRFGFEMEFYSDASKALEALALNPMEYALVMTDVRMPGVDGLSFVKSLRSFCPKLGVVFMTGDVSDELRESAEAFGNVVFLEKPFQLEKTFKETIPALMG